MTKIVPQILAFLTLIGDISILCVLFYLALNKFRKLKISKVIPNFQIFRSYSYVFAFIVTLTATLGSLFYSEVIKFQPCILCWYQRIMMYSQTILLYIAIARNEKVIKPYLIALNIIGAAIAGYHYLIQRFPQTAFTPCSIAGGVSCIKGYTYYYGYISIPFMALTAFVLNIILLQLSEYKGRK